MSLLLQCSAKRLLEWQLVVASASAGLDDVPYDGKPEQLGALDWESLIRIATQHRVTPLICRHLSGQLWEGVPETARTSLEELVREAARWNLFLTGRMVLVLEALKQAGVPAVPFKGPILASIAYGDLGLRPSTDLDFILPQRCLQRAYEVLAASGFCSGLDPAVARDARYLSEGSPSQHCFFGESDLLVELHTEKTLRYFPAPFDWDDLESRLVTFNLAGRPIQVLSAEDTLVFLSVHGAKHFWERLIWICDIARIAQLPGGVDLQRSERLATKLGCRRMWLLALSLARQVLDAPLEPWVVRSILGERFVSELGRWIVANVLATQPSSPGSPARFFFRLLSYDSLSQGTRQCFRVATQATEEDWRAHDLPRWATRFHGILRPLRLLRRQGLR